MGTGLNVIKKAQLVICENQVKELLQKKTKQGTPERFKKKQELKRLSNKINELKKELEEL